MFSVLEASRLKGCMKVSHLPSSLSGYLKGSLCKLAEGIAQTFGSHCEVLLYDLTPRRPLLIKSFNCHIHNQDHGAVINLRSKKLIEHALELQNPITCSEIDISGRKIKSSVMLLGGGKQEWSAALIINFDVTDIVNLGSAIEDIFKVEEEKPTSELSDPLTESAATTLEKKADQMIEVFGGIPTNSSRKDKVEIVAQLNQKGFFSTRGAVELLAEKLGVSKFAVYSYLGEVRKKTNSLHLVSPQAEWKIPFLVPLTGAYSGFGRMIKWTVDYAVHEINSQGGVSDLPLIVDYHDTNGDPRRCATEASKVLDSALVLWGPLSSIEAAMTLPLTVKHRVLAMPVACGPGIVSRYQPWAVNFYGRYRDIVSPPLSAWLKRVRSLRKIIQFVWPTDPTWMESARAQREVLEAKGVVVLPDTECFTGSDFSGLVASALAQNPDGFLLTVSPVAAGQVVRELDHLGIREKERIMVFNAAESPALYQIAGSSLNGAYHWNVANPLTERPRWVQFKERFEDVFKTLPPVFGIPMHYDMVYLTKQAIEHIGATGRPAGSKREREKIKDYCRSVKDFSGLIADFSIHDGIARTPCYLFQMYSERERLRLIEEYLPEDDSDKRRANKREVGLKQRRCEG
jgi:predicted transcriptional regulator YheO